MTSTDAVRLCRRVSGRQLELLWEYLNTHRELATAYNRSLQAKEYSKQKWRELAEILNSQGDGVHKDWKGWSKYWVDYKAKLKKKVAALRAAHVRTGGGPAEPPLNAIDEKFLEILGEGYGEGLPGVRVEPFVDLPQSANETPSTLTIPESPSIIPIPTSTHTAQTPQVALLLSSQGQGEHLTGHWTVEEHPFITTAPTQSPEAIAPVEHTTHTHSPHLNQHSESAQPTRQGYSPVHSSPRRRRRRRERPLSQEAARRALVQSSQQRADSATRSAEALQRIPEILTEAVTVLRNIERAINAALPRVPE